MSFEIPESYRAYCTDVAVRTAVDHILSSADSRRGCRSSRRYRLEGPARVPPALLSAHQVRCEYAVHLIRLWNAVWEPVLDESDFGWNLEPWTVGAAQEWNAQALDTHTVWNESWFARGFDIVGTNFQLSPGICDVAGRVHLSFSFWGQDDNADHTTGENFGDDWPKQRNEDGCASTTEGIGGNSE